MKLYEIADDIRTAEEMLEAEEFSEDEMMALIDEIVGEFSDKAQGLAVVIKETDYSVAALAAEIKTLTARKKALEKKSDGVKDSLTDNMLATGIRRLEGRSVVALRKSQRTVVADEDAFMANEDNAAYVKKELVVKIDKAALRDELKEGVLVDGAALVDHWGVSIK
jgi:hypothetical protein